MCRITSVAAAGQLAAAGNQSINHRRLHSTHAGCQASMQGLCTSSGSGTARCMHMLPPLQGDATPSTRSCFPASCNRCVACSLQPHCYACCAACCSLRASTRPQAAVMLRLISSTMTAGLAVQMTPQCFQENTPVLWPAGKDPNPITGLEYV
ncbi:hypothetical protein COO60DRAFT_562608 [Scenedesmus sp. NREL 46B-D3]|nr:hypothetical protein COO60DRAFT_562608 [Scenedesmus sp. NREL 46B-D3]